MKPKESRPARPYHLRAPLKEMSPDAVERAGTNRLSASRLSAGRLPASIGLRLLTIQEEVQQRIASDLHDSTCQHLVAASLSMMRLRRVGSDPDAVEKVYDDIDASIDQALREIRAFTYLLYPQNLLTDGLKSTIEQYVIGFSLRTSLKSTLAIAPEIDRLSYDAQRALLRVIQEALSNVFRHAKATQVRVTVEAGDAHLRLRVSDDGCGMSFGRTRSGPEAASFGVGIPGMRTRVHQLGGTFEIEPSSTAEGGTTICAVIPYALRRNGARASGEHHGSRH